jgi:uncharacterized protein GlcG (DUF336 family)
MRLVTHSLVAAIGALGITLGALEAGSSRISDAKDQPKAPPSVGAKSILTLDGANLVLAAAVELARQRGASGAVAIVDDGGSLIAFQRLDGSFPAAASVSVGKARTAAMFRKPTSALEDSINGGRIALAAVAEMTPLKGGVPIMHAGEVIGAIGVSGAHSQGEDEEIAMAGVAALDAASSEPSR